MSDFLQSVVRQGAAGRIQPEVGVEARTPFWDAVRANFDDGIQTRRHNTREEQALAALWERHAEVERRTGQRLPLSDSLSSQPTEDRDSLRRFMDRIIPADAINARLLGRPGHLTDGDYEARLERLRAESPDAMAGVPTRAEIMARLDARWRRVRAKADAASEGVGGFVASLVGQTGAAMTDPAQMGVAAATGGAGAGRALLTRLGVQAAANAGAEGLEIGDRIADAARYGGPEYSAGEAAFDVTAAGVGGMVFEAGGSAGRWGLSQLGRRLAGSADPTARGVARQIDLLDADEAVIGAADDFDGARQALASGAPLPRVEPDRDLDALFANQPATVRNGSQPASPGGLVEAEYRGRRIYAGRFDPLQTEADPVRFQYKADGDAEGVTGRLRGVERWDATASGKALLFEDADGRVIVADGHQRRGLARRLAEQGWEDAQLDGYLFRAADGWTAQEVRVVAALKNIREGSGAVLDAAKVFREAPAALNDRSLPVTGDFIANARHLASLSDDAFRAVINGVLPERYAAVIGEQAQGRPDIHADLVDLLRRGEPKSVEGARALVQEGLLDDFIKTEGMQLDLFGGLPRESTVIARGRIREAVLAGLRRDERLNAALVRNADAIEAGGNVLARSENEARLAVDRAASELVSRLALRSGEMGEAFSAAAAAVTKGETTPGVAAKGLLQRIRAAVAAGERLDLERAEVLNPEAPTAQALDAAGAYDAPGGAGQKAQAEPKPEDVEIEAEAESLGLFDDMPETGSEERALSVLRACAPGGA